MLAMMTSNAIYHKRALCKLYCSYSINLFDMLIDNRSIILYGKAPSSTHLAILLQSFPRLWAPFLNCGDLDGLWMHPASAKWSIDQQFELLQMKQWMATTVPEPSSDQYYSNHFLPLFSIFCCLICINSHILFFSFKFFNCVCINV